MKMTILSAALAALATTVALPFAGTAEAQVVYYDYYDTYDGIYDTDYDDDWFYDAYVVGDYDDDYDYYANYDYEEDVFDWEEDDLF